MATLYLVQMRGGDYDYWEENILATIDVTKAMEIVEDLKHEYEEIQTKFKNVKYKDGMQILTNHKSKWLTTAEQVFQLHDKNLDFGYEEVEVIDL